MHTHCMQFISRLNGEEIHVDKVIRITTPKAEEWIQKFDEHTVDMCHKFGIIYQKEGQVCVCVHVFCVHVCACICVCMYDCAYRRATYLSLRSFVT